MPEGKSATILADLQWVRTVLITLQDNPTYLCPGFDAEFRPALVLDKLRDRPTNFRWTNATIVQLLRS